MLYRNGGRNIVRVKGMDTSKQEAICNGKRKICFPPVKSQWVYFVVRLFRGSCLFYFAFCFTSLLLVYYGFQQRKNTDILEFFK